MAKAQALGKTGARYGDLKRRLVFLVLALVVYRPVPTFRAGHQSRTRWRTCSASTRAGSWACSTCFGRALSRFSIFALGIMPYISASIIMQLMSVVVLPLEALKKEGEAGRRKITQYTRYGTVELALVQAVGISVALESQPGWSSTRACCSASRQWSRWLPAPCSSRGWASDHRAGLGNGISILIFAGIVAGLPSALADCWTWCGRTRCRCCRRCSSWPWSCWLPPSWCFVKRGQRKITVNYAKRQVGNKVYGGGQSSHLLPAEHGRGDSADLRIVDHSVPGHDHQLFRV